METPSSVRHSNPGCHVGSKRRNKRGEHSVDLGRKRPGYLRRPKN